MALPKAHLLLGLGMLVVCQGLGSAAFAQGSGNIFRYHDANGRLVYNSHVPAEFVKNGYTILNSRGQVLQEVPRARTAEEIAAQEAALIAEKAAAAAREAQEEADQLLIRLYRSPEEIDRKRDNMLGPIDAQIGLLTGNISKLNQAMVDAQTVVDNYAKAEKQAPVDIATKAERAKEELAALESRLLVLQADRNRITAEAERDSSRLRQLLGATEQPTAQ